MYRRPFVLFAGLSVLLSIPAATLSGVVYGQFAGLLQATTLGQTPNFSNLQSTLVVAGIFLVIDLALVPFFYGAVAYAACESALGRPVTAGGARQGVGHPFFPPFGYV